MKLFDVIVIGVGGMGSATLFQLAKQNLRVLGIERYQIPNEMGSSHGLTRIIRLAYCEHPDYVPLVRRSYELWSELEHINQEKLLFKVGSIDASRESEQIFTGSLLSCELHDLPHEVLSSKELHQRFPGYQLPADILALYQPDGGFLLSERCIVNYARAAETLGAEIHTQEQVKYFEPTNRGIKVETDQGSYFTKKLIITAGAWTAQLMPELAPIVKPERQVLAWFEPLHEKLFAPEHFPVFNMEIPEGRYYGFPIYEIPGFKVGRYHHMSQQVDPDVMDRTIHPQDEAILKDFVKIYFKDAAGQVLLAKTCLFTNSPDEHFILDFHPTIPDVCVAAGFSGHGFKFCSVVGEIMADLALKGHTSHNINLFSLKRFLHQ